MAELMPHSGSGQAKEPVSLRARLFQLLDTARERDYRLSKIVDAGLITLISLSVVAVVLESIRSLEVRYSAYFYWFEAVTVAVFSIEYLLRVWTSVESNAARQAGHSAWLTRLRFMGSFHAIIDLLAILPFYLLSFGLLGGLDMRFLRAVRLLRILKLTRYSAALNILVSTFTENGRSLSAAFFILLMIMLLAASGMYFFERNAQPVAFSSIPAAMWWAFATLTTVGYGDVTPVTVGGKVFGALITVVGLGMVALPTGILASGFAQQIKARSDEYQSVAEQAWEDGILTDEEMNHLERLRVDLGLGKHTASQILDSGKVQRSLEQQSGERCPHCAGRL